MKYAIIIGRFKDIWQRAKPINRGGLEIITNALLLLPKIYLKIKK